jgi:type IV pilus assembly protein PilV
MTNLKRSDRQCGVSMIEVLISIVILSVGLLGVAGIQARMQVAEIEAYQRTQAIVLLQDMVDRINSNRKDIASYVTATPVGTGSALNCAGPASIAQTDLCDWNAALQGAAETGVDGNVGAMTGARGCIENPVAVMPREVVVTVAWQGLVATAAPDATVTCGAGLYGDEMTRRTMVARITIGCMQNDPATGVCVTP